MWQYGHSRITMVVADGLVLIWYQAIDNDLDGVAQPACVKSAQRDVFMI